MGEQHPPGLYAVQRPQGRSHSQGGSPIALRNFVNGAPLLTLSSGVNSSAVTLTVSSTSGYPAAPFTIALERGTVNEEVVLCTALTGTTFTVTRGWDGTTGKAHASAAIVEHTTTAADYVDANAHVYDTGRNDHTQYLLRSLYTAKGSIMVATAASTPANLAVGANDTVFMADSGQSAGAKWSLIGSGSLASSSVTFAKLDTSMQQNVVQRVTTGTLPGSPTTGQVVATTDNNRLLSYLAAAWQPITHGVGRVYVSTGSPSGGADGDVWLRYV